MAVFFEVPTCEDRLVSSSNICIPNSQPDLGRYSHFWEYPLSCITALVSNIQAPNSRHFDYWISSLKHHSLILQCLDSFNDGAQILTPFHLLELQCAMGLHLVLDFILSAVDWNVWVELLKDIVIFYSNVLYLKNLTVCSIHIIAKIRQIPYKKEAFILSHSDFK